MASKRKRKNDGPTLAEFLAGSPLTYTGYRKARQLTCRYQPGVGVVIQSGQQVVGLAEVKTEHGAKNLYWNLTRRPEYEAKSR